MAIGLVPCPAQGLGWAEPRSAGTVVPAVSPAVTATSTGLLCRGSSRWRRLTCKANSTRGVDGAKLDQAAVRFGKGVREGADPDELVAQELGTAGVQNLSDVQDKYKDKLRDKLAERAMELEREKALKQEKFALGKTAYSRGQYAASTLLFESALNSEGPFSALGGEIQLWLALSYQAEGREEECIELYKRVEATHPMPRVKKQAADLRYIMEAPKLVMSPDEKVAIPVLNNLNANRRAKPVTASNLGKPKKKVKKSLEEEFLDGYQPPAWTRNYYVWVASSVVAIGLAAWSVAFRSGS